MKAEEICSLQYPGYKMYKYRGISFTVDYDQFPESPEEWEFDRAFLVSDYRNFMAKSNHVSIDDIRNDMEEQSDLRETYLIYPVSILDHSGIFLSLESGFISDGGGWDTTHGRCFILVNKRISGCYKQEDGIEIAQSILDLWQSYINGDVYMYNVDVNNEHDCCGGFYGDGGLEEAISEAEHFIDSILDEQILQYTMSHINKRKDQIKNKVPYLYREPFEFKIVNV